MKKIQQYKELYVENISPCEQKNPKRGMSHSARSCGVCKFSEPYFRGLLCHWVEEHQENLALPAYLVIAGAKLACCDLHVCYPYQLDNEDYGKICSVFEVRKE